MSASPPRTARRLVLALGAVAATVALCGPAAAQAGVLVESAPDCGEQVLSNPFTPWLDPANYTMPDGGAFEDGAAAWSLADGAEIVSDNEPYYVHAEGDAQSLSLPPGSSAVSSTICVGLEHPTLRFFARNTGSPFSSLEVSVRFEDAAGEVHSLPIGTVGSTASWQPTAPFPVVANLLPLLPGEHTPVEFEFTPHGSGGNWKIDDVYVDPYRRS